MKTVFKGKLRKIKKVLSKSSISTTANKINSSSNSSNNSSHSLSTTATMSTEDNINNDGEDSKSEVLSQEIQCLREQVASLKCAVEAHQSETEQKAVALAEVAREKERITHELRRQKSINTHLINQLEDERRHYYEAKQAYCQEMAELKRLQAIVSNSNNVSNVEENERIVKDLREQVARLKSTLSQTMEANYNLSVKFLRMKNSKTCVKSELHKLRLDHEKIINVVKTKMCDLKDEINYLIDQRMVGDRDITSSSKKYLQIVKQNSCLVYENLCQQLEMDRLNARLDKIKMQYSKQAAKSKLKYSSSLQRRTGNPDAGDNVDLFCATCSTKSSSNKICCEQPEKLEKLELNQLLMDKKSNASCSSSKRTVKSNCSGIVEQSEAELMYGLPGIT